MDAIGCSDAAVTRDVTGGQFVACGDDIRDQRWIARLKAQIH